MTLTQRLRRGPRRRRGATLRTVAGVCAVVLVPTGLAAALGSGAPATRLPLTAGVAWLASPSTGLATLVDGASEQVVGSVRIGAAGADVSVVQADTSAYAVDGTRGTVSLIDGATYEQSAPVPFTAPGTRPVVERRDPLAAAALDDEPADDPGLVVVDPDSRTAAVVDPRTLAPLDDEFSLAARPGPQQSAVDGAGRLWVVDGEGGGLTWFEDGKKQVNADVVDERGRMVVVRGQPVLVDVSGKQVGRLDDRGRPTWSCLDLPEDDGLQLLGSVTSDEVWAVAPSTGTMLVADLAGGRCQDFVPLADPGDELGTPTQNGRFVFVPNRTDGTAVVVDTRAQRVVADPAVADPGSLLELVSQDAFVFYNDLASQRAGVLRADGAGSWVAGEPLDKYDPGAGAEGANLLAPSGADAVVPPVPPEDSEADGGSQSPEGGDGSEPDTTEPTEPTAPEDEPAAPGDVSRPRTGAAPPDIRPRDPADPAGAPGGARPSGAGTDGGTDRTTEPTSGTGAGPGTAAPAPVAVAVAVAGFTVSPAGVGPSQRSVTAAGTVTGPPGTAWTLTITNPDCGTTATVASGQVPPEAVSRTFDVYDALSDAAPCGPGPHTVVLRATADGAVPAQSSAPVQVAENPGPVDCQLERVDGGTPDLRATSAIDTISVRLTGCPGPADVTKEALGGWAIVLDVPPSLAAGSPVSVTLQQVGFAPVDGLNPVVRFSLESGATLTVDALGNRRPQLQGTPTCSTNEGMTTFIATLEDADTLEVSAHVGSAPAVTMTRVLVTHGTSNNYIGSVSTDSLAGRGSEWTLVAQDPFDGDLGGGNVYPRNDCWPTGAGPGIPDPGIVIPGPVLPTPPRLIPIQPIPEPVPGPIPEPFPGPIGP